MQITRGGSRVLTNRRETGIVTGQMTNSSSSSLETTPSPQHTPFQQLRAKLAHLSLALRQTLVG